MITARVTLPNFRPMFESNINKEIRKKLASRMVAIVPKIKSRLSPEVASALKKSNVYQHIIGGGRLLGELGIPNPSALDDIIDVWAENINVEYKPSPKFGVIQIGMIEANYSDVLSIPQASFTYVSKTFGVTTIDWLRWLLLEGPKIVVVAYEFEAGNGGRTGLGIMHKRAGGGWSVPGAFSGISGNNFATRALQDIEEVIDDIVRQEITKGI